METDEECGSASTHEPGKQIDRSTLYAEVWSTPLTKLAPTYGFSDAGLRKVCIAMDIPLPGIGHWAKVAAGHVIQRPPLPEQEGSAIRWTKEAPAPGHSNERIADQLWFAAMEEKERALPEHPEPLPDPPVIDRMRTAIQRAQKKTQRLLEELRTSDRKRRQDPRGLDLSYMDWYRYTHDGYRLSSHEAHALNVSSAGATDALEILAAFCKEAVRRNFTLAPAPKGSAVQVTLESYKLEVTVRERYKEGELQRGGEGAHSSIKCLEGSGEFVLVVGGIGHSVREFKGSAKDLIQSLRSGATFVSLYRRVVNVRQQQRIEDARRREWEEKWRTQEVKRAAELAAEEARRAEVTRRQNLFEEASQWRRVNDLRNYIAAVHETGASVRSKLVAEWIDWATRVANESDPLIRRLEGGSPSSGQ